ncbi:MAG: DUF3179 domain-containing protein, partial [Candidatus Acidiferrales bacterium]
MRGAAADSSLLSAQAPADLSAETLVRLLGLLTNRVEEVRQRAYRELQRRNDPRVVAGLIELLRLPRYHSHEEIPRLLAELTGENFGVDWVAWNEWLTAKENVELPPDFLGWKSALFRLIDPEFGRFLYPGVPLRVRPEEIVWGGVMKDGIPALTRPKTLAASEAGYLTPDELVFGVEINGEARAYPHRILDWHEMVNDVVGGVAVSLAYCTLCRSGILFETTGSGKTYTFGSSGLLYRSNKLMYDHQTESLWMTLPGEPVSGALASSGLQLKKLPVVVTTWDEWRRRHPATRVLSLDTGHQRDYRPGAAYGEYFTSPLTLFPVPRRDPRLPPKEEVFALVVNGRPKAYPLAALRREPVLNDTLGGELIVLVTDAQSGAVRAYRRGLRRLRAVTGEPTALRADDGSRWRITEAALVQEGSNERLERLPGHTAYW